MSSWQFIENLLSEMIPLIYIDYIGSAVIQDTALVIYISFDLVAFMDVDEKIFATSADDHYIFNAVEKSLTTCQILHQ